MVGCMKRGGYIFITVKIHHCKRLIPQVSIEESYPDHFQKRITFTAAH